MGALLNKFKTTLRAGMGNQQGLLSHRHAKLEALTRSPRKRPRKIARLPKKDWSPKEGGYHEYEKELRGHQRHRPKHDGFSLSRQNWKNGDEDWKRRRSEGSYGCEEMKDNQHSLNNREEAG